MIAYQYKKVKRRIRIAEKPGSISVAPPARELLRELFRIV
jgi:hypothetical protein